MVQILQVFFLYFILKKEVFYYTLKETLLLQQVLNFGSRDILLYVRYLLYIKFSIINKNLSDNVTINVLFETY